MIKCQYKSVSLIRNVVRRILDQVGGASHVVTSLIGLLLVREVDGATNDLLAARVTMLLVGDEMNGVTAVEAPRVKVTKIVCVGECDTYVLPEVEVVRSTLGEYTVDTVSNIESTVEFSGGRSVDEEAEEIQTTRIAACIVL